MTATTERLDLTERCVPIAEAASAPKGRRFSALLIKAGWSLNGRHYGEAMLKRDGAKAFPAGALQEADHPSAQERQDRPEGSVKNVVSTLLTAARWDARQGGLVADVEVFPQHEALLNERFAKAIGLSIRVSGTGEQGEAEGRKGLIVTSLDEGGTVDWVTHPGAGGKVLQLIESAPVLQEGHGMTASDLSRSLRDAVSQAYEDVNAWAYVADYSDDFVVFRLYGDDVDPGLYQSPYTVDAAGTSSLTGTPVEVNVRTEYVPCLPDPEDAAVPVVESATPATAPATADVSESTTTPKEAVPVTTPEPTTGAPPTGAPSKPVRLDTVEAANQKVAELTRQLTEARTDAEAIANDRLARVQAETDLDRERLDNARLRAVESVRSLTQTALNESRLPACVHPRVLAAVTGPEGTFIPLTESRTVDTTPLKAQVETAIKSWQILVDDILESAGVGRVNGFGTGASGDGAELTEAQVKADMKASFIRQGMSEAAAEYAATGRN